MAAKGDADELVPFLIRDVVGLTADKEEKREGFGAYGYVFKVNVKGVERIAKKIHSIYVNQVNPEEKQGITSKFRAECIILSKLRHPNIVQFVGVHYGKGGMTDLTLFMECLSSDMDKFLSSHPNLPLSLKLSLLQDVSFGLVYLHECVPPIIHRDLTAKNILISDKCQAKIADVGVAKAVDIRAQQAASHTKNPGQMFYMPPEALKEKASCTPKLDIFSFGHLALYTVNQEFPEVYDVTDSLTMKMKEEGTIQRERRRKFIDRVGEGHCLYPIITECLFDNPDQRPVTRDLNSRLCLLATQYPHNGQAEECEQLKKRIAELDSKNVELEKTIQTTRTESTNLRGCIKEQGLRLKREKEEGNRERAELSRMRQEFEKSQQLTRELEEMLESARTESENLRDHIKEQAQLIVRLEREKEEGNSEQDQLLRTRQEESQHLIRELEEMLETARTESANLRDHMKEQAQLISRLKQEKKEGNRLLKRELEEMLEKLSKLKEGHSQSEETLMEVVDNLSKQMERMSIERDDARNAAEQRKVKVSKEYKIKEFNRMKQQFREVAKGNVKLVEQLEEVRKENRELLKKIKKEQDRQRKADKKSKTSPQERTETETAAEELVALRSQKSMWRADVKHYQEVIKTLSIGIRDGALFSSVDEKSLATDQWKNSETQGNPFQDDPDYIPSESDQCQPEIDLIERRNYEHKQLTPTQHPFEAGKEVFQHKTESQAPRKQAMQRQISEPWARTSDQPYYSDRQSFQQHEAHQSNTQPPTPWSSGANRDYQRESSLFQSRIGYNQLSPTGSAAETNMPFVDRMQGVQRQPPPNSDQNRPSLQKQSLSWPANSPPLTWQPSGEENERTVNTEHSPYDPNLVCPMCGKKHLTGEIQKFRKHMSECGQGLSQVLQAWGDEDDSTSEESECDGNMEDLA